MARLTAVAGQPLPAVDFNNAVRDQVVEKTTSAARPTATEGQTIFETDTNRHAHYDGTTWVYEGIRAKQFFGGSNQTGIVAVTDVTGSSFTITMAASRVVLIGWTLTLLQNTNAAQPNVVLNRGGADIGYLVDAPMGVGERQRFSGIFYDTPGSGSITYKLRAATSAGTLTINNAFADGQIFLVDVGPA